MMSPGDRLFALLREHRPEREAVAAFLDSLDHRGRLAAVRALDGSVIQQRLWELCAEAPPVTLADLVPPQTPPLGEVIWYGKNSLPACSLFEKRFCRPSPRHAAEELWGYNHYRLAWLTGPGYFVCHPEGDALAAIDYRRVPPEHPAGWPAIQPNDRGLARFVYRDLVDYLRRVARHVLVGRATRHGKALPNFFVLCREG